MKIKQFKEELLKGNGACVIEVYNNPKKYKNALLSACKNGVSYDPQSNGTHGEYIYNMIALYDDKQDFLNVILKEYSKNNLDYWMFDYLTKLLLCLNKEYDVALEVINHKINELYFRILEGKTNHEEEGKIELLALNLLSSKTYYGISSMIGYLLKNASDYLVGFDWILEHLQKSYVTKLYNRKNKNENIQFLFDNEYLVLKPKEKMSSTYKPLTFVDYKNTLDIEEKKKILIRIKDTDYTTEEIEILIQDLKKDTELKDLILYRLSKIRHPLIRELALKNKNNLDYWPMLITNASNEDMEYINEKVREIPVDFEDEYGSHYLFGFVIDAYKHGVKIDKDLLIYVYENLYCSYCKYETFIQLKRRNALTNKMVLEATYDACDEIRMMARKILGI